MCLIVYQPANVDALSRRMAKRAWQANPHGAGFAIAVEGQLHIDKGFFRFKEFWQEYRRARSVAKDCPIVIHFRFATHGSLEAENTHPFEVAEGNAVLAHNGILSFAPNEAERSDSRWFAETALAKFSPDILLAEETKAGLEKLIGFGNKFVILAADGRAQIVNEDAGHWENGAWFSGTSHRALASWHYSRDYSPGYAYVGGGWGEDRDPATRPQRERGFYSPTEKRWVSYTEAFDDRDAIEELVRLGEMDCVDDEADCAEAYMTESDKRAYGFADRKEGP